MRNIKQKFLHIILPAMILTPLLWLMAGCIYVPWFENPIDHGPNLRGMIGQKYSNREIRPGNIIKSRVIELLGRPRFKSPDGSAIGYLTHTGTGYWIWPLCFEVEPNDSKSYAVRLVFNDSEKLIRVDWAEVNRSEFDSNQFNFGFPYISFSDSEALAILNRQGAPKLLPTQP